MRKTVLALVLLQFILGTALVRTGSAALYKYVDQKGVDCYADNLQVVPEQYRSTAVIVQADEKETPVKAPCPAPSEKQEQPSTQAGEAGTAVNPEHPFSFRLMLSGVVVAGAFLLFMILNNQKQLKGNERLRSIVRLSLVVLVSVYLVAAHARDVMVITGLTGRAINDAQQRSAEKGKKAAQAIKQLDTLLDQAQQEARKEEKAVKNPPAEEGQ